MPKAQSLEQEVRKLRRELRTAFHHPLKRLFEWLAVFACTLGLLWILYHEMLAGRL